MNFARINEVCEFLLKTSKDYHAAAKALNMTVKEVACSALEGQIVRCGRCEIWNDTKNVKVSGMGSMCSDCYDIAQSH